MKDIYIIQIIQLVLYCILFLYSILSYIFNESSNPKIAWRSATLGWACCIILALTLLLKN